ncbi:hypothetical protein DM47_3369 [Burkholderia mallei]|nr:hypothetical protein DM75_4206 [Burkholderia mallei]KOS77069.1 hypothetical protein DM46_3045 [Burkholderia mallei]KOS91486.1 hypothetical protein DM53_4485 [Burkholderia mallei]KOS95168.1 hypothetical protein DM45_4038 [Burkholderia mallei]KOS99231.1 hypothetical protein DM49_4157 [Burkholderia mallei]
MFETRCRFGLRKRLLVAKATLDPFGTRNHCQESRMDVMTCPLQTGPAGV